MCSRLPQLFPGQAGGVNRTSPLWSAGAENRGAVPHLSLQPDRLLLARQSPSPSSPFLQRAAFSLLPRAEHPQPLACRSLSLCVKCGVRGSMCFSVPPLHAGRLTQCGALRRRWLVNCWRGSAPLKSGGARACGVQRPSRGLPRTPPSRCRQRPPLISGVRSGDGCAHVPSPAPALCSSVFPTDSPPQVFPTSGSPCECFPNLSSLTVTPVPRNSQEPSRNLPLSPKAHLVPFKDSPYFLLFSEPLRPACLRAQPPLPGAVRSPDFGSCRGGLPPPAHVAGPPRGWRARLLLPRLTPSPARPGPSVQSLPRELFMAVDSGIQPTCDESDLHPPESRPQRVWAAGWQPRASEQAPCPPQRRWAKPGDVPWGWS